MSISILTNAATAVMISATIFILSLVSIGDPSVPFLIPAFLISLALWLLSLLTLLALTFFETKIARWLNIPIW